MNMENMKCESPLSCKKCVFKGYKKSIYDLDKDSLRIRVIEHCEDCIDSMMRELEEMNSVYYPELDDKE
jgi:hypothetical protein